MKRSFIILSPPLVFALTAGIAWLAGAPDRHGMSGEDSLPRGPRHRAADTAESGGISTALLRMERQILPHNPVPPRKNYDAKGMEDVCFSDVQFPGSGMASIQYANGFADDAPEEMYSWLLHQGHKEWLYASILFKSWAAKDMNAALEAAAKIPNLKLRAQALVSSLEILCASDPDRARDLLEQNLSLFNKDESGWLAHQFDAGKACIDVISSLPVGEERAHLLAGLLNQVSDSSDAVDYWQELPESERRNLVAAGFSPYMKRAESYEGLVDLMRERAETSDDPTVVRNFIQDQGEAWAKRDLAGALEWVQAHMKGEARAEWRNKFFQTGIRQAFDTTIRVWRELPDGYAKADVADAILRAAPETRKAEVEALLKSFPQ